MPCSVFGAVDSTEPRGLLPAVAAALRPGGRLVLFFLAGTSACTTPDCATPPHCGVAVPVQAAGEGVRVGRTG